MPRKEKFEEYDLKTKTTTIRIPDLKDINKERELRRKNDVFVVDFIEKGLKQKSGNSYEISGVDQNSIEIDKELYYKRTSDYRQNLDGIS